MRKIILLVGLGLSMLLSSCYRNSVCATYTYNDQNQTENAKNIETVEKF